MYVRASKQPVWIDESDTNVTPGRVHIMSSVSEPGTEGSNSQKAHCEQSRSVQRCGKGQCWYSAQKVKWQQTYVWQCHKVTILSGVKTSWVTEIALRELHSDTLWVALSFKVCEWVRHPWDLSRSPLCSIYKRTNVLYWASIINYQLLPLQSVLYWPSTQLHHLVTHSWANWI